MSQYRELMLAETRQALACQLKHDAESRLCQWLLRMDDWQRPAPIAMTQQALARFMGVRRTTVTLIAQGLQDAGIISYRRGIISIADHLALHQASCECYRSLRSRYHAFHNRFATQSRRMMPLHQVSGANGPSPHAG
jgi:hypothetical protein